MFDFLQHYSDNTRLWIYQSPRAFSAEELIWIDREGGLFAESWKTHGTSMKALVKVLYDRFLIIAADEDVTGSSGCSVDSSVRFIKGIEQQTGVNLMDRMLVYYMDHQGNPVSFHFHDLGKLIEQGVLTPVTNVFNPLVTTKPALLNQWLMPLERSWLANFVTG